MNLNVFIKFVLCIKTNKNKPTKIITPLLLKPTDISARAMPRAKNSQQKLKILKKATLLYYNYIIICLTRSYTYSMIRMFFHNQMII